MVAELKIIVKDDERKLEWKDMIFEDFTTSEEDPLIKWHIERLIEEFGSQPDQVQVRISLDL